MNLFSQSLALLAALHKLAVNPRALRHVCGTSLGASREILARGCDLTRFPKASLADLVAGAKNDERVSLSFFPQFGCSVSPMESLCLALLLRKTAALRVFEFGTYLGISTTQLALNVAPTGSVFTLDLPEDDPRVRLKIDDVSETALTAIRDKGRLIPADLLAKVVFLKKDSADFDESPYAGTMDFVFVDGAHSADYVRNDSEKGWRMLRPGGVIAWHDCRTEDPDVVHYLLQCPFQPKWINGTSLAFAVKT